MGQARKVSSNSVGTGMQVGVQMHVDTTLTEECKVLHGTACLNLPACALDVQHARTIVELFSTTGTTDLEEIGTLCISHACH